MSRDYFVRPVLGSPVDESPTFNPEAKAAFAALLGMRDKNQLDADVLTYPQTTMLSAYDKATGKAALYVPVQRVFMLDGLGIPEGTSAIDVAAALAQIIKTVHYMSIVNGHGELYFPCSDSNVNQFAQRHGFTLMDYDAQEETGADGERKITVSRKLMPFYKLKTYR